MRSSKEWKTWGRVDPLWAVASWPGKEAGAASAWTRDEFVALGASDFQDIAVHWRHFGTQQGTCVEIGCGAGRITLQLLTLFTRVAALDVSTDQIEVARQILGPKAGAVTFHLVDGMAIPLPDSSCAGMFSSHVFQHFSSYTGIVCYLKETFRVLAPGGTACFHVPVTGAHRSAPTSNIRLAIHNTVVTLRRLLGHRRMMEYHRYSATRVFESLRSIGFKRAELRIFDMTSNGDAHSFFFAQRP